MADNLFCHYLPGFKKIYSFINAWSKSGPKINSLLAKERSERDISGVYKFELVQYIHIFIT